MTRQLITIDPWSGLVWEGAVHHGGRVEVRTRLAKFGLVTEWRPHSRAAYEALDISGVWTPQDRKAIHAAAVDATGWHISLLAAGLEMQLREKDSELGRLRARIAELEATR